MKTTDKPEILFEQLNEIENKFTNNAMVVDQNDLIAIVFAVALAMYQSILAAEQVRQANNLTVGHLETVMTQMWRQNKHQRTVRLKNKQKCLWRLDGKQVARPAGIVGRRVTLSRDCPKKRKNQGHGNNNNSRGGGGNNGGNKKCNLSVGRQATRKLIAGTRLRMQTSIQHGLSQETLKLEQRGPYNNNGGTDVAEMLFMAIDGNEDNENNEKKMGFPEQLALAQGSPMCGLLTLLLLFIQLHAL